MEFSISRLRFLTRLIVGIIVVTNLVTAKIGLGQEDAEGGPRRIGARSERIAHAVWFEPLPPRANESRRLPRPLEVIYGDIQELNQEVLRVVPSEGQAAVSVTTSRIIWIEPQWRDEDAKAGVAAFAEGRYEDALPRLQAALQKRPDVWQQQWLLAHVAMAAHQVGKHSLALAMVGYLHRSRPPTFLYALLPIEWTSRPADASRIGAARESIDAEDSAVRLVAASWLLSSTRDSQLAEGVLESVVRTDPDQRLVLLAESLRWRRVAIPKVSSSLAKWDAAIDRLPIALQGGPLLTIADRLDASGITDRAQEYYWGVALLNKCPRSLADTARAALAEIARSEEKAEE